MFIRMSVVMELLLEDITVLIKTFEKGSDILSFPFSNKKG